MGSVAFAGTGTVDLRMAISKLGRRSGLLAGEMENHISVPEPVSDALARRLDVSPDHTGDACTGLVAVLAWAGARSLVSHGLHQTPISA